MKMCCLIVLEVQWSKARCWQSGFLPETVRGSPSHAFHLASGGCGQSSAFLGLWIHQSHVCLCLHMRGMLPVHVCALISLFLCRHQSYWVRAHLHDLILLYLFKGPVSKYSHVLRYWGLIYTFEGEHNSFHHNDISENSLDIFILPILNLF